MPLFSRSESRSIFLLQRGRYLTLHVSHSFPCCVVHYMSVLLSAISPLLSLLCCSLRVCPSISQLSLTFPAVLFITCLSLYQPALPYFPCCVVRYVSVPLSAISPLLSLLCCSLRVCPSISHLSLTFPAVLFVTCLSLYQPALPYFPCCSLRVCPSIGHLSPDTATLLRFQYLVVHYR